MWKVLLVDDSAVARRVLARRLEAEGFLVSEASSVATARKVDFASLGCAVVDLELADGDGTDLARALLERRPPRRSSKERARGVRFFSSPTSIP
jgi:two-component system response regulator RegA